MDTPDIFSQPPSTPPANANAERVSILEQDCQDLRTLFNAVFFAVLFLALAVNVFMYKQMRLIQQQVNEQRPMVLRADAEFRRNRHPEISQFMAQLQTYAASHREYQTNILDRYRLALAQYFNSPTPVQAVSPLSPATNLMAPRAPGR